MTHGSGEGHHSHIPANRAEKHWDERTRRLENRGRKDIEKIDTILMREYDYFRKGYNFQPRRRMFKGARVEKFITPALANERKGRWPRLPRIGDPRLLGLIDEMMRALSADADELGPHINTMRHFGSYDDSGHFRYWLNKRGKMMERYAHLQKIFETLSGEGGGGAGGGHGHGHSESRSPILAAEHARAAILERLHRVRRDRAHTHSPHPEEAHEHSAHPEEEEGSEHTEDHEEHEPDSPLEAAEENLRSVAAHLMTPEPRARLASGAHHDGAPRYRAAVAKFVREFLDETRQSHPDYFYSTEPSAALTEDGKTHLRHVFTEHILHAARESVGATYHEHPSFSKEVAANIQYGMLEKRMYAAAEVPDEVQNPRRLKDSVGVYTKLLLKDTKYLQQALEKSKKMLVRLAKTDRSLRIYLEHSFKKNKKTYHRLLGRLKKYA